MMNSRQKEVLAESLKDEEKVLKKLFDIYIQSEKEISEQIQELKEGIENLEELAKLPISEEEKEILLSQRQSKVYQKRYQDSLKKQLSGILDDMHKAGYRTISEYLNGCYENGFIGVMYDLQGQGIPMCFPIDQNAMIKAVQLDSKISEGLYTHLGENVTLLKRKISSEISRGIATGMSFQRIAKQISLKMTGTYENPKGSYAYARRIAATEGHRIQVQSAMDACYKAREKGADVLKQWDSTLDDSTRESHQKVDGEIRELTEKFSNGLMFPGDPSGGAKEVIQCRCALLQRARWALDEDELENLKKRAEYFGLDKTDNFEDYKKKYLKATKKNSEKSLTYDDDNGKMSVESKIQWHKKGKILTSEQRRELTDYANERNIKLTGLKNTDVDISLMKEVVDDAEKMLAVYPELNSNPQQPFTIKVVNGMSANDFAMTTARKNVNVIQLNANAFRNKEKLAQEYQRLVDEGWFVKGTTYRSIIIHEIGHMYSNVNKISNKSIVELTMNAINISDRKALFNYLKTNLSLYSSSYKDGSEIISEVFSDYFSKDNSSVISEKIIYKLNE